MIQSVKESVNDTLNIVYNGRSDQTLRKKVKSQIVDFSQNPRLRIIVLITIEIFKMGNPDKFYSSNPLK